MIIWEKCTDQLGSLLVASLIYKSMAREAKSRDNQELADKLVSDAKWVNIFCYSVTKELYDKVCDLWSELSTT